MLRQSLLLLPILAAFTANCDSSALSSERKTDAYNGSSVISREDRELLDKMKAREQAKAQLAAQPSLFVSGGNPDVVDRGLIDTYTLTRAIEFENSSDFDVADISGKITYKDKGEAEMAIVPFTASGELRAGQTAKLKVKSREITGRAYKAQIHVERLRILGGT